MGIYDFGLLGWDVQSGNLAQSMASLGSSIGVFPGTEDEVATLELEGVESLEVLVESLESPRILILSAREQARLGEALRLLEPDDVIIDVSDSWFRDTCARARLAAAVRIHFVAFGLGANENGPRPLLLPSGRSEAMEKAGRFFKAVSPARAVGSGPSGHFVKMVHGAVESAFAEIVREVQSVLQRGLREDGKESLLKMPGDPLFDCVRAGAVAPTNLESNRELAQWAARAAGELEIPALTFEAASGAREWKNGEALGEPFCQPHGARRTDRDSLVEQAHAALTVATVIAYSEGLALLAAASDRFGLHMDIPEILRVWRSGVAGRGRLLGEIQAAFERTPGLPNLLFDDDFSEKVMEQQELLRHALARADEWNLATPALAMALRYIDTFRDAWLPINLVQPGDFHWSPRRARALAGAPLEMETEYGG